MKSSIGRMWVLAAAAAILSLSVSTAQAVVIAGWNDGNLNVDASVTATVGPNAASAVISRGAALGYTSAANVYNSSSWHVHTDFATAQANGQYVRIDASTTGYQNISLKFSSRRSNTGPPNFQLYYSADGGENFTASETWNLPDADTHPRELDLSSLFALNDNAEVVLLLVGIGATGNTGTCRFSAITIEGDVSGDPTLIGAYAFDGKVVAVFNGDPGAVAAEDFSLAGSQTVLFTAIEGTGNTRTLTPDALLVGDDQVDTLAVVDAGDAAASDVDFYVYPPIALIQQGTIPALRVVGVRAVVTGVRTPEFEGDFTRLPDYAIATAEGAWNGMFVDDAERDPMPAIGDEVELLGTVTEPFTVTTLNVTGYINHGPVTPIEPTLIPDEDFVAAVAANTLPNEKWEGVLIRVNGLRFAQDANFGETVFLQGVKLDGAFYDARTEGDILDSRSYDIVGIGFFSFSQYKILPRGSFDILPPTFPAQASNTWMLVE